VVQSCWFGISVRAYLISCEFRSSKSSEKETYKQKSGLTKRDQNAPLCLRHLPQIQNRFGGRKGKSPCQGEPPRVKGEERECSTRFWEWCDNRKERGSGTPQTRPRRSSHLEDTRMPHPMQGDSNNVKSLSAGH
jgi:hypothetical protein